MSKWEEKKLKNIGTIITGNTPPTKERDYYGTKYKFIKPTDMTEGLRFVQTTEEMFSEKGYDRYKKSLIPANSPCVVTIGSLGKKMCLTNEPSFTNQAVNAIVPYPENDGRFIYYFMKIMLSTVKHLSSGTASGRENVSKGSFSNIKILCPSLPTQQKIADILSAYDDLIENNNRRIEILEKTAENIYKEWFVRFRFPGYEKAKFENGIPQGWEVKRLIDIANINMGQSPPSEYYNEIKNGLPFHQGISNFGNRYLSHEIYCTEGKKTANSGDILFSVRAPVGRLNITNEKIIIGRGLAAIRSKIDCQSFQYYQLKNYFFKDDLLGSGSIFNSITKKHLEEVKLLTPKKELIEKIENIIVPIDKELENLIIQNQNLIKQRDLLLPRLMSGKIEV